MAALVFILKSEILLLLAGLASIVAYQMLTGRIVTRRMLFDKRIGGFSPGRAQLLVVTLNAALFYLVLAADNPKTLPDIPPELLLILGGSNVAYLGGKASSLLFSRNGGA